MAKQYIVTDTTGPLELCFGYRYPTRGILMHGDHVTVFPSRKRAKGAIDRTKAYSIAEKLNWHKWNDRIWLLKEAP